MKHRNIEIIILSIGIVLLIVGILLAIAWRNEKARADVLQQTVETIGEFVQKKYSADSTKLVSKYDDKLKQKDLEILSINKKLSTIQPIKQFYHAKIKSIQSAPNSIVNTQFDSLCSELRKRYN